jgi:hypothetical protein
MDTDRSGSLSANELKVRAKALMLLEGRPPQLC